MSKEHQKQVGKYFPKRSIQYNPGLSRVLGSVNAGIMLNQIIYWHGLGSMRDGWIYKTMEDMYEETGLTRTQQETAIRVLKGYDFFEYKLSGIPQKRHFRINLSVLENQLPSMKESAGIVYPNPPRNSAGNPQTITKNTHETTPKNINRFNRGSCAAIGEILDRSRFTNDFVKRYE